MRSGRSIDGYSCTRRAGLPARAVGSVADQRTVPVLASRARRPISVLTTMTSGPACRTCSSVAPDTARTKPCIRPPSPRFGGPLCWNRDSLAQRCAPVTRSKSATTGGPLARRPCTSRVPLCGSTRRVTTCVKESLRESNTVAPVTGSKTTSSPGRAASISSAPSTMRTLSAGKPPSSGRCHATAPCSISTPESAASVDTSSTPAGVTCCQRMSPPPGTLSVHAGVTPAAGGAWARTTVGNAKTSSSMRRVDRAAMVILRWPPISPQRRRQRKSGGVRMLAAAVLPSFEADTTMLTRAALVLLLLVPGLPTTTSTPVAAELLAGLRWRNLGPFRAGRVAAVSGAIGQPGVFYIGLPLGGVWKTTSAGETWFPIMDDVKEVSSVGAVEVAPSDPNVVYVGMGDLITGGGINEGNGVYKSVDAGKTWQHLGLDSTKQIPSILVDPHDPNLVMIAAQGDVHKKSET